MCAVMTVMKVKNQAAIDLGKLGGRKAWQDHERMAAIVRENGKKGGRPRKKV